jgi:hypothetical protein
MTNSEAAAPRKAHARLGSCIVERVTGIGGFFFRARSPEALKVW